MTHTEKHIAQRFARSRNTYTRHAQVQETMACELAALVKEYAGSEPGTVLELGAGPGTVTQKLLQQSRISHYTVNDLVAGFEQQLLELGKAYSMPMQFLPGDATQLSFNHDINLLVSGATIQWFAHPEVFVQQSARWLAPGGWFIASSFGSDNLQEIRNLTGVGLHYHDYGALLGQHPDFTVHHIHTSKITTWFAHPLAVLQHLQKTGVTGLGASWGAGKTRSMCRAYQQQYAQQGKVPLTYQPTYFVAQKKCNTFQ